MKYSILYSLIILITISLLSCSSTTNNQIQQALNDALSKFPDLPMEKGKLKDHYELVRSVEITHPYVKLTLFEPVNLESKQRIVLMTNEEGMCYVIPLPSPRYKIYWNYVYDTSKKPSSLPGRNFEAAVNDALTKLKLNQDNDGIKVLAELFRSLLSYQYVGQTELSRLSTSDSRNKELPDSCIHMQSKILEDLKLKIDPEGIRNNMTYQGNDGRIYSYRFKDRLAKDKPAYYLINVYRLPCIIDPHIFRL